MAVQTATTTTQRPKEVHGMNDRVRRLREESLNTQPRIYIERAVLETEAYENTRALSPFRSSAP